MGMDDKATQFKCCREDIIYKSETYLIKTLPFICSFFFTEDDIPTNMSYQDTTLDL
jgi:hypothetical protein